MPSMEEEFPGPMPPQPQTIGISLSAIAGEFLLFLGLLFIMLGAAAFLTDMLGIKGSGEVLMGLVLILGASALLFRSMKGLRRVRRRMPPVGMAPPQPPKKKEGSENAGSYR